MTLKFHIVWFDDQPHNLQSIKEGIEQHLGRKGLDIEVEWVKTFGDIPGLLQGLRNKEERVDLVLMDWDLGRDDDDKKVNGADLAKRVRNALKYTDIIFYSAETPKVLRQQVAERDVDGVYCANRNDLVDQAVGVAFRVARKSLTLESIRGAYVAYATELDHLLTESLQMLDEKMTEDQSSTLLADAVKRIRSSVESNQAQLDRLDVSTIGDLLKKPRLFDSSQRLQTLIQALAMLEDELDARSFSDTLSTYQNDVLDHRNVFAHQRAEFKKGKSKLRFAEGFELTHGEAEKLRSRLRDHRSNLDELYDRILRHGA